MLKQIINAKILTPQGWLKDGSVIIRDNKILSAENDALKAQLDLLPLINALFCEVNPIPVKAAMEAMGFCTNEIRLPLTPMEDANFQRLLTAMRRHGLNV